MPVAKRAPAASRVMVSAETAAEIEDVARAARRSVAFVVERALSAAPNAVAPAGETALELVLDEDYRPTVVEHGEPSPVMSGGEEDLTNLALRLAVSQMIAERSGQPLSILVLDEIFGSLDEAHRTQVVDQLRRLESRFPQVVLITHIEGVRESVDHVLRVRYDEAAGASVVEEERGSLAALGDGGGGNADVAA